MFYFSKMQGTGNDFIIIDCLRNKFEYSLKKLTEFLCNRHYGVGADGVLFIDSSKVADLKMRIFNKDGSEAEMCGNGIRCFAKYVFEHNILKKENINIETLAGIKNVSLNIEGEKIISVKVDMGEPIFEYDKIPVIYDYEEYSKKNDLEHKNNMKSKNIRENKKLIGKENIINKKILIDDKIFYAVSLGNPHVVCFEDNIDNIDIQSIGKRVEDYKYFPNKTNIEFVQIISKNRITVRIWERGVGETLSCGTGACAAAVISNLIKSTNSELIVDLKGGNLKTFYNNKNNIMFLEGDAEEIYEGKLKI